ncbi:hypothetical protein [Consotaella aegiceratis]|uniref:hypothetical protein n=1 Tax=Consotaella aegiceratis TaxID=3097961 RepID=UPI002F412753
MKRWQRGAMATALVLLGPGTVLAQPYTAFPGRSHGGPEIEVLRVRPRIEVRPVERQRLLDAESFRDKVGGSEPVTPVKPVIPRLTEDVPMELRATEGTGKINPANAGALARQGSTAAGSGPYTRIDR